MFSVMFELTASISGKLKEKKKHKLNMTSLKLAFQKSGRQSLTFSVKFSLLSSLYFALAKGSAVSYLLSFLIRR